MAFAGKAKRFNNAKGFGFLSREGGPDVFVHYTSIERDGYKSIKEGQPLEFDVIEGATGRRQADHVCCLDQ